MRRGAAAEAVGITREAVYHHRKKHPEFADEERLAEIEACELVEDVLYNMAIKGNMRAIEMWLSRRSPERWSNKLPISTNNVPIVKTSSDNRYYDSDWIDEFLKLAIEYGLLPRAIGDGDEHLLKEIEPIVMKTDRNEMRQNPKTEN